MTGFENIEYSKILNMKMSRTAKTRMNTSAILNINISLLLKNDGKQDTQKPPKAIPVMKKVIRMPISKNTYPYNI